MVGVAVFGHLARASHGLYYGCQGGRRPLVHAVFDAQWILPCIDVTAEAVLESIAG